MLVPFLSATGIILFGSKEVTLVVKRQALQMFFLSSQLFQAGCWPELRPTGLQKCKVALIRAYRLVTTDGYANGTDDAPNWLSDEETVAIACQMHPVVLLRYLRIMTVIRLASRASWNGWCILFAAKGHTRSWLTSLPSESWVWAGSHVQG